MVLLWIICGLIGASLYIGAVIGLIISVIVILVSLILFIVGLMVRVKTNKKTLWSCVKI